MPRTKKQVFRDSPDYHISPPISSTRKKDHKRDRNIARSLYPHATDIEINPYQSKIAEFAQAHHRTPTKKELKHIRKQTARERDEEEEYDSESSVYSQRYDSDGNLDYFKKPSPHLFARDNNFILESNKGKHTTQSGIYDLHKRAQKEKNMFSSLYHAKTSPKLPKDMINHIMSFDNPYPRVTEEERKQTHQFAKTRKLGVYNDINHKYKRKVDPSNVTMSIRRKGTVK